jgi:hypothetical protein
MRNGRLGRPTRPGLPGLSARSPSRIEGPGAGVVNMPAFASVRRGFGPYATRPSSILAGPLFERDLRVVSPSLEYQLTCDDARNTCSEDISIRVIPAGPDLFPRRLRGLVPYWPQRSHIAQDVSPVRRRTGSKVRCLFPDE